MKACNCGDFARYGKCEHVYPLTAPKPGSVDIMGDFLARLKKSTAYENGQLRKENAALRAEVERLRDGPCVSCSYKAAADKALEISRLYCEEQKARKQAEAEVKRLQERLKKYSPALFSGNETHLGGDAAVEFWEGEFRREKSRAEQAEAALERVKPLVDAVMGAKLSEPTKGDFGAVFMWETDDKAILRAALAYREKEKS
jgi:glutaredoxin